MPSASQLPIIVAMIFLFRTEAEYGGEQSRRRQHCSANPTPPWSIPRLRALAHTLAPCSPRRLHSLETPSAENSADHPLRRGAACALLAPPCPLHLRRGMLSWGWARYSVFHQRHTSADALAPESVASPRQFQSQRRRKHLLTWSRQDTASCPELRRVAVPNSTETSGVSTPEGRASYRPNIYQPVSSHLPLVSFYRSHISNRNCPANRSRRKQNTKPCLTGTRIAQCRARFSFAKSQSHNCRSLATNHSRLATVASNRELLVLEIPQLIENTRRQPVLIENFEPNSAPVFPSFVAAAFLARATMGRRAGFPLLETPPNRSTGQGAA